MKYKLSDEIAGRCIDNLRSKPMATVMPSALDKVEQKICTMPLCNKRVEGFDDELSLKEYIISGICQECQDSFFEE